MIRLTAEVVATFARIGIAKVKKDIYKGVVDPNDMDKLMAYMLGHRILGQGLDVLDVDTDEVA